ncbi:MAG: amidohydrolase family protein, partial [Lactococcus garvieae]
VLMLKDAIKNVVDWGIATPEEALMMASLTAAKSVNIDDCCGQIKEDYNADFIVLKSNMELSEVYVNGKQAMSS